MAHAYERTLAGWVPKDRDGDGVSDGREWFWQQNPADPADFPFLDVLEDAGEIDVRAVARLDEDGRLIVMGTPRGMGRWAEPGQTCRIHAHLESEYGPTAAPPGLQFRVKTALASTPEAYVARRGEAPVQDSVIVPVTNEGHLTFDVRGLQAPPPIPVLAPLTRWVITLDNARTGWTLAEIHVMCAWPLPPVTPTVETIDDRTRSRAVATATVQTIPAIEALKMIRTCQSLISLRWPPVSPAAQRLFVEVARDDQGAGGPFDWMPILATDVDETSAVLVRFTGGKSDAYAGPLKYRVVPVRYSPAPSGE